MIEKLLSDNPFTLLSSLWNSGWEIVGWWLIPIAIMFSLLGVWAFECARGDTFR